MIILNIKGYIWRLKNNKYKLMKFFKFFQYAYLVFAALFLFDAVSRWSEGGSRRYISLLFAALAVFMFFFKRNFNKRFDNNKRP